MKFQDDYNDIKHWEITKDSSGHYHLSQFINGELKSKVRTTKKWIEEIGILDMKPILPETEKKHNERNAGRKQKLTDETIEKIKYDRRVHGRTIRDLAKQYNASTGLISNILNKQYK